MGLSNSGDLFYSHAYATSLINTEIRSSTGAVVYSASISGLPPTGSIPVFTAMSPNGRLLIGRYDPSPQTPFLAEVCPVEVTPSATTVPMEGGTVTVSVKADADCEWYSEASGRQRGNGEVSLTMPASQAPKTSHVWVAWQDVVILQGGGACEYRLPGTAYLIGAEGGTVRVPVTTAPDCPWLATGGDHVDIAPAAGTGPGELTVTVKPGESPQDRRYSITIGDAVLIIHQDPAPCRRQFTFPSELGAGSGAAMLTQQTQPECHVYSNADVDWLRPDILVRDSPALSHQIFFYGLNSIGQSRAAQLRTGSTLVQTRQQIAAPSDALLVEPALSKGPRQKFRFTFAEPAGEPEVSIGKACNIHYRGGFFPFNVDGSCQLNDAGVTSVAGRFRTIDLDVTLAERGPLSIVSGTRSLGAFLATDRAPESPRLTAPKPPSGATGFSIDSDHGYGGTFRMVLESANRQPIRIAALTFQATGRDFIRSCTVELIVATRQFSLITYDGTGQSRAGPIELGATGTLESDACIVKGVGGAFTAVNPDGSRAVWDVTLLFRSTWSGLHFATVEVVGSDGVRLNQGGQYYTIDPQVNTPSVALYSDLLRVGISASAAIASARVAAGACLFEYDPAGGLRAGAAQPCRLDLTRSAAVASGTNLTLVLAYSGDQSGGGLRPLKVEATPVGGVASGWFQLGQVPAR
ncbi:MAG: BACON domain-containing protein [Acidobacteria bacterium]|nr:BACON domain-containing protein [Acidobacteriota bacterium]